MELDIGQMALTQLVPNAGRGIPRDQSVVQHGDAGTTDHGVQAVAVHELKQSAPQSHDDATMAVIRVNAAAAQLHHAAAHIAQACQVELGVAVGAACPLGLHGREHPVGANDLTRSAVPHQQVLAVIVKQIDVVTWHCFGQPCAQLGRKDLVPQALRFPNFVEMRRPADCNGALHTPRQKFQTGTRGPRMK